MERSTSVDRIPVPPPPSGALMARYLDAQLLGDQESALQVLFEEGLGRGTSVQALLLEVIQPAQREIGRLWQENVISVAQEHLATAISQMAVARLYQHLTRAPANGKSLLVSCVEGETHELGARVAADFLALEGFKVRFLGASVPTVSLLSMVTGTRPDLIALSVTMTFHLPALREAIAALRSASPGTPIVVGGHAFSWAPQLPAQLGVDGYGADATGLVSEARRLLGLARR